MSILIINSAEPGERSFVNPIAAYLEDLAREKDRLTPEPEIRETHQNRFVPEVREWREFIGITQMDAFKAVIISASPMGNNANFEEPIRGFEWVRNVKVPVLGICAGHQFIGIQFGGRLLRNQEPEKGITPVRIHTWDPVFNGYENEIEVMQQHNDSITLPENFILLARSERCRVQAMKHRDLPVYGVQWHAEISTPGIFRNLVKMADINGIEEI